MGLLRRPIYHRINIYTYEPIYTYTVYIYMILYVYIIYLRLYVVFASIHIRGRISSGNDRFPLVPGCMSYNVHDRSWEKPLYSFKTLQKQPPRGFCFRPCTPVERYWNTSHLVRWVTRGGFHAGLFFAAIWLKDPKPFDLALSRLSIS